MKIQQYLAEATIRAIPDEFKSDEDKMLIRLSDATKGKIDVGDLPETMERDVTLHDVEQALNIASVNTVLKWCSRLRLNGTRFTADASLRICDLVVDVADMYYPTEDVIDAIAQERIEQERRKGTDQ